jgi:CRISPR-associated protein Csd1
MILQALNEYYHRKRDVDPSSLPPPGMEFVEISFAVVLRKNGTFFDLADLREGEGKSKRGKIVIAPQGCDRTGQNAWATAFLLWDHPRYVFGMRTPKDGKDDDTPSKRLASFKARILKNFPDPIIDEGVNAVFRFIDQNDFSMVEQHQLWTELLETTGNVSFRLTDDPENFICEYPVVIAAAEKELDDDSGYEKRQCLITGDVSPIAVLHSATPLPSRDSKSTAKLVSFQKNSGYDSYGKEQGGNAPVGKRAVFAYTTAMNYLLAKGSQQRIQVGDSSTVFWAEKPQHPAETLFRAWDNPDLDTGTVKALLAAPNSGVGFFEDEGTRFYVLGLAPNAARIAVRFWHVKTVGELAVNIRRHFDDLRIDHAPHEPETLSLNAILKATSRKKSDGSYDTPPNLGGEVMRSVIENLPYPQTLLSGAIRRIRAEQEISYPRAAIIKACINRYSGKEELKVSLDENNTNTAYRLGRLFAVLERIQERASPNLNATIRDRYYGAASSTPVTVFSTLLKLKNHHLAKLDNKGEAVNYEKLLGQIMDGISDFPAHLDLQSQGRFAIGYYHQRQAFFTKSESTNKGE